MVGRAIFSIEVELGWGFHDMEYGDKYLSPGRTAETQYLERLLDLCDELTIPLTFDVVGHLLLDNCTGEHEGHYPTDWFGADPGSTADGDPHFYAPDLVEAITQAKTDHEICTHTFSHVPAENISDQALVDDLAAARSTHDKKEVSLSSSLVLPRHEEANREVLREAGIDTVRIPLSSGKGWENMISIGSRVLGRHHPVANPNSSDGVIETYSTPEPSLTAPFLPSGQAAPPSVFRPVPKTIGKRIQRRYLTNAFDRAMESEADAHLWTHLYNLSNEPQFQPIEAGLRYAARRRDMDELEIITMEDLAST